MNLFDMATRGDKHLSLSASVVAIKTVTPDDTARSLAGESAILAAKHRAGAHTWRGFQLSGDAKLVLADALHWYPFCERPETTGWHVMALQQAAVGSLLTLRLIDRETRDVLAKVDIEARRDLRALPLPSVPQDRACDLELSLHAKAGAPVFLAVHYVLDRSELIAYCRGKGIELGPGPHPQVLPARGVDVTYVEQSSPADWQELYNKKGKYAVDPKLWNHYEIGEAHPLPAADTSLDFIFSSHVFEHLANPLGHLQHWFSKLRSGGVIAAVVPDVASCKDYVYRPCAFSDLLEELAAGSFAPSLAHYARWAAKRAPGKDPAEFLRAGRSIHVHYYSKRNMEELLRYAVEKLRYADFRMWYSPNHKDFFFLLRK